MNKKSRPTLELMDIYRLLLERFGNRKWWPGETLDEIIIGAILTQSVAWTNVETALRMLSEKGIRSLEDVLATPEAELAPLIRSTLYYNQKTQKLKNFARFFQAEYGSKYPKMFATELPILRQKMLAIKGLGPETVDSILLYAGGLPVFVVDSYTDRLLVRLGFSAGPKSYAQWQEFICSRIPENIELYQDFHAQIDCLCKALCKPVPRCGSCPLSGYCPSAQTTNVAVNKA